MKKLISIILCFSMLGCSTLTGVTKGTKKTFYDQNGKVTSTEEDKALDDKYSNYSDNTTNIVNSITNSSNKAITAIAEVYKPRSNDSEIVSLAKAALAGAQITSIKVSERIDLVLAQIKYGKDGYDVADTVAGGFVQMIVTAIPWLSVAGIVKRSYDTTGDRTSVTMGNDNYVTLKQEKTQTSAYITAINNGRDNSGVQVPYAPNITGSSPPTTTTTEVIAPTTTPTE